ncbi:RNA polymerase sigma factor [Maribacter sp. 1_2014MBL_MicDiv]|uniref:RNA polymerase sigma factor n=1 Tax=Maribacter sp. 1_2014MBL_MicDiv TaxID=1644130 RepID=UPI0008F54916|nr:sigma-70 family RNA polymerase sigma factor [Maribacter sp. 1_2014MBL_MicDiv]APA64350.1 sigma factor, ECF subfamily protein [Maribacter sp. 1_2014MBL_MicDiv]
MEHKVVDHLFRHHYGKMVAILTRFFGLSYIETIEDAVQDTFIKATSQWRTKIPDNPEAWLNRVAKNRTIDILRSIQAEKNRNLSITTGASSLQIEQLFLDHEVADSQLRMIFVACHPSLHPSEQIAFALKTISGFSIKEIAAALLTKEETIAKRLLRARKTISDKNIQFQYPSPETVQERMARVMEVIYLTFNEGFHSTNKEKLIKEDLCGEAIRLCQLLLKKEQFRSGSLYALFALLCFHMSRLESKVSSDNQIVNLRYQDRTKWYFPLIKMGNSAMLKATEYEDTSVYHYEAAIASEHLNAKIFKDTNWRKISYWYEQLHTFEPNMFTLLNHATVCLQLNDLAKTYQLLNCIEVAELGQRGYLYYGCYAEFYLKKGEKDLAISFLDKAMLETSNSLEKKFLTIKRKRLIG